MHRAAESPERFLTRGGFARLLSQLDLRPTKATAKGGTAPGVVLPADLERFLRALDGRSLADFRALKGPAPGFVGLLRTAGKSDRAASHLVAHLASAIPFGETMDGGAPIVCFQGDPPAHGLVATLDGGLRGRRARASLVCRGIGALAVMCSMHAIDEDCEPPAFGVAEEEAIRAIVDRARALALLLIGTDAQVRSAARALALRPLDLFPPEEQTGGKKGKKVGRTGPIALGANVESFFRDRSVDLAARLEAHVRSADAIVAEAAVLLTAALGGGAKAKSPVVRDLARRRDLALRAAPPAPPPSAEDPMETTRRIVEHFDRLPPTAETFAARAEREETLAALSELGDPGVVPSLVARALTGDAGAVDMLAALRDRSLIPLVVREGEPRALDGGILGGEPTRLRLYEAALVRMIVSLGARGNPTTALRLLLQGSPLTGWREGLERGALVRELVIALGELEDEGAAPILRAILESTSQEYRLILPSAAYALGQLEDALALPALERLLLSPKAAITCEALWAVGAIAGAHPEARESAAALLDRMKNLEPGAEVTKLVALAKSGQAPKPGELRAAIERALWEPAYRQEDTSRRRVWGLRAVTELAELKLFSRAELPLGHETVRHFVTRDDERVRAAADSAFRAWGVPVPKVRKYWGFLLPAIERQGGLDALLEAVRDPLGLFRHNVATRIAEIGDPRAVRPLAEATARLFGEPKTSTYEYDDAPPQLVAFVRALARLNRPEGNDVLIEGLRSDNHQVRAVIAENAPEDERFVPELMAMLGDPRSFLRSRAEKSLTTLGAIQAPIIDPNSTEVAIVRRIVEG